jgi:3-deoxy-D-manno-octulosonic-acid transferase
MSLLTVYRLATCGVAPLARLVLARRAAGGKEDKTRLGERWGRTTHARPSGTLIWLHAASVGESLSLLPLIERLLEASADNAVLVTTGTVTSARLMADRLPAGRAWHQYAPLDHPPTVRRFLDHWRPDLAIWVESELWPNLIIETRRRGIKMALLNARMSERSWRGWRRMPGLIRRLLSAFDLVLAQDSKQAVRLQDLGARHVDSVGDLKAAMTTQDGAAPDLAAIHAVIGDRPVWLAASTHEGEELIVAEAHRQLRRRFPTILTLLAPRHPVRAPAIVTLLEQGGIGAVKRSDGALPGPDTDVWLIDTLGELGLFYRLTGLVLVAGSLCEPGTIGGHNPLEAASLGRAVLHGPDMANAAASTAALDAAGAARLVIDADSLAQAVGDLIADPAALARMGEAGSQVAEAERGVVDKIFQRLSPLMSQRSFTPSLPLWGGEGRDEGGC